MPQIDPESLKQLRREVEKIPPQSTARSEAERQKLLRAVARMEKESLPK